MDSTPTTLPKSSSPPMLENDPFFDPQQVAEYLSVSLNTSNAFIRSGELKAVNISNGTQRKSWRVRRSWLDEFVERRSNKFAKAREKQTRSRVAPPVKPRHEYV